MSNLYLWIPKDFDERYKKYSDKLINSDNKKPEPSLVDKLVREKEDFLLIKNKTEYESEMKKWEPLKIIVDAIYIKLSHLDQKPQVVDINISELGIPKKIASSVLMKLRDEGVFNCRGDVEDDVMTNQLIVTTTNIRKYLNGDGIIVQNYDNFRSLRKEIIDFYNFLEEQKVIKFPTNEPVFTDLESQKSIKTDVETSEILSEKNNLDSNNTKSDVNLGNNSLVKSVFEDQGKMHLSFTDEGKDPACLGKKKSVPHLLIKNFSPLGELKSIDYIFQNTTKRRDILNDKKITKIMKAEKIKRSLSELKKILKPHGYKVSLTIKTNEGTVCMKIERR